MTTLTYVYFGSSLKTYMSKNAGEKQGLTAQSCLPPRSLRESNEREEEGQEPRTEQASKAWQEETKAACEKEQHTAHQVVH